MPYLSKQTIMGHIGKNVESKSTSDTTFHVFTVAVNQGYGDKKITNWYDVTCFRTIPDWKYDLLKKGALVLVTGDFKFTITEKNGKNYPHLNITADTIEVIPKSADAEPEQQASTATEFNENEPIPF